MLGFFPLFLLLTIAESGFSDDISKFSRDGFPSDFVFGAGTSAYQVEGAVTEDGRSQSIWDTFTHAGRMVDKSTGDIASDGYHKYKEDVKLMSDIGLDAYRFSISWSRLIPNGRGVVNPKGLEYYNNLIDELIEHGILPHVSLYHLDHPQILEDEYGGWLSSKIVKDFTAFADVCFREFGDRVTHWTTLNEPNVFSLGAFDNGILPPGRCSYPFGSNCTVGNSSVEPYIVAHHALLAHSEVYMLYKEKYQVNQNGLIGLNIYTFWCSPLTNSTADVKATQRALDFYVGWIINPLLYGDYPVVMKRLVGSRMPSFSKFQSDRVKGSFNFIGLNHYATVYVAASSKSPMPNRRDFNSDMYATISMKSDKATTDQVLRVSLPGDPSGLQNMLEYFEKVYDNPPIYIQENGYGGPYNETLNDTARVDYLTEYLKSTLAAIRNGSNTRGYFVWALLDVFELLDGYESRYGLIHVNFEDKELTRTPKFSAHWYSNFLKKGKEMNIEETSLYVEPYSS